MSLTNWRQTLLEAANTVVIDILGFIPDLVAALVVLWLGTILAKWVAKLIGGLLHQLGLDGLAKKTGFNEFLRKADVEVSLSEVAAQFFRWVVVFIFFMVAVNILGLPAVSQLLGQVLIYVPNIVSAAIILTVGFLLAGFVENLITAGLSQLGKQISQIGAKIAYYLLLFVVVLAAINELGIAQSLTNILFTGLVASLALGFGLALGLGAKDIVKQLLEDWYREFKE